MTTDNGSIWDDEDSPVDPTADSAIRKANPDQSRYLEVYQAGKLTVAGFAGKSVPREYNMATCRSEIIALIRQHACEHFAFDLTGISFVPSGILGLIASILKEDVKVSVYNASPNVREAFEMTRLHTLVDLCEVELDG